MTDPLALWALIVALLSLMVALGAGFVAYLDYQQIGREEPWKLTKVQDEIWLLERVHRRPATISGFDVTTLCDVVQVSWLNPAAFPAKVFRRGSQELLRIETASVGVHLDFYSREYGIFNRLPTHNTSYLGSARGTEGLGTLKTWTTALY
ncbi:hypothetical protein ACQCSV_13540 [Pseudarthrobacter sp. S3]|uniref:hypothetical protein n=1 Tax=Pseudarthrobacter sp. S3 TaxID=3418419 RepID=UPI003CFB5B93